MICRQCAVWRPVSEMNAEEAVKHLIEVHPNRAAKFMMSLLKSIDDEFSADPLDVLDPVLRDRVKEGEF